MFLLNILWNLLDCKKCLWSLLTAQHRSCFSVSFSHSYLPTVHHQSCFCFLSLTLTCNVNTLVCMILPLPIPKFAYKTRHRAYKLPSQWLSCFRFSVLPVLYTQDTFAPFLNFKVGHFSHQFLFLSFSVAMKGIQFIQLRCHISSLVHSVHYMFYFIQSCKIAEFM